MGRAKNIAIRIAAVVLMLVWLWQMWQVWGSGGDHALKFALASWFAASLVVLVRPSWAFPVFLAVAGSYLINLEVQLLDLLPDLESQPPRNLPPSSFASAVAVALMAWARTIAFVMSIDILSWASFNWAIVPMLLLAASVVVAIAERRTARVEALVSRILRFPMRLLNWCYRTLLGEPHQPVDAWKSLILVVEVIWLVASTFVYFMGLTVQRFSAVAHALWDFNLAKGLGAARPYQCCERADTTLFLFFTLFPAVVLALVLLTLRWLDRRGGLSLLERLKKLFWK